MSQDSVRDCPPESLRYQNGYLLGELKWKAQKLDEAQVELSTARERIAALEGQVGMLRSAVRAGLDYVSVVTDGPVEWLRKRAFEVGKAALASTAPTTEGQSDG